MSLDTPPLDDLTWAGLTTAARDGIVAASNGRWTLHAPVDPGVTLVELFAALVDERSYWVDQPDDARARRLLALLGVTPAPAGCARTVFALSADAPTAVPSGTQFRPAGTPLSDGPAYRTLHALDVLPLAEAGPVARRPRTAAPAAPEPAVRLWVNGVERTAELVAGLAPDLVPAGEPHAEIEVRFRGSGAAAGTFGVLFGLDEFAPTDGVPTAARGTLKQPVTAPATLAWHYSTGGGWSAPAAVDDRTGGLRRPGIVRIRVESSAPWEADATGYGLRVVVTDSRHPTPPRVTAIAANAVAAEHRTRVVEAVGKSGWTEQAAAWRRHGRNELILPRESESPLPERAAVVIDEPGRPKRWRAVPDLASARPQDQVFVVDRAGNRLVFGDGRAGRVPRLEPGGRVRVRLEVGGGPVGNVGAGLDWVTVQGGTLRARSVLPAGGGSDPETIADAVRRAAGATGQATRIVTPADAAELALGTPGVRVRRAVGVGGADPRFPGRTVPGAITVYVVPAGPDPTRDRPADPPLPDAGFLSAVEGHLEGYRLLGQRLHVLPPAYRDVCLVVRLGGPAGDEVEAAVRTALARFLHPAVGGADGTGWSPGTALRPSALARVARAAAAAVEAVAIEQYGEPEACADVSLAPAGMPRLRGVRFVGATPAAGRGVL